MRRLTLLGTLLCVTTGCGETGGSSPNGTGGSSNTDPGTGGTSAVGSGGAAGGADASSGGVSGEGSTGEIVDPPNRDCDLSAGVGAVEAIFLEGQFAVLAASADCTLMFTSDDAEHWTATVLPIEVGGPLQLVIHEGTYYVVKSQTMPAPSTLFISSDLRTWERRSLPTSVSRLVRGDGVWFAFDTRRDWAVSEDASDWDVYNPSQDGAPEYSLVEDAVFGAGVFLAFGGAAVAGALVVSEDARNWDHVEVLPADERGWIEPIYYLEHRQRFVGSLSRPLDWCDIEECDEWEHFATSSLDGRDWQHRLEELAPSLGELTERSDGCLAETSNEDYETTLSWAADCETWEPVAFEADSGPQWHLASSDEVLLVVVGDTVYSSDAPHGEWSTFDLDTVAPSPL